MNKTLKLLAAALLAGCTAQAGVVFSDTDSFTVGSGGWVKLTNSSTSAGAVLGESTLTGGSNLDFSFASATNTSGGTVQYTDWNSVLRAFTAQGLAIGDKLTVDLQATANTASGNIFRGIRALNVSFVGGVDPLPGVDTATLGGDYQFPSNANYSLTTSVTFNNKQHSSFGHRVGSNTQMLSGSGFSALNASLTNSWTGSRYVLEMERIADIGTTSAAFTLTATLYAPDNVTVEDSFSYTANIANGFPTGATVAFSALVIGSGSTTQWNNNATMYGQLALDNVSVTYTAAIPEPSSFALLSGLGVLGLAAISRRRRV